MSQSYSYISSSYDRQPLITTDLPLRSWWNQYSKGLFILALFWLPDQYSKVENSMFCFITSLFKMFPHSTVRRLANDFLHMKDYVINVLIKGCSNFFKIYPSYLEALTLSANSQYTFLKQCLKSSESLFMFVYLFQCFILIMHNKQGHHISIPHFIDIKNSYVVTELKIEDWGRPIWFMIHTVALYAPDPLTESFKNYKQILTCLQYLLPCAKCRDHLTKNLSKINLDKCARNRLDMFRCSWDLHNIVNKDTNKPELTFREALDYYTY